MRFPPHRMGQEAPGGAKPARRGPPRSPGADTGIIRSWGIHLPVIGASRPADTARPTPSAAVTLLDIIEVVEGPVRGNAPRGNAPQWDEATKESGPLNARLQAVYARVVAGGVGRRRR